VRDVKGFRDFFFQAVSFFRKTVRLSIKMSREKMLYFAFESEFNQFGFYPTIRGVNAFYSIISDSVSIALSQEFMQKERGLFAKTALVRLGLTTSSRSKNPT
jgi:hypothetical protein